MKEHWSISEEKLLELEGGSRVKAPSKEDRPAGKHNFYKGVIQCMKLVLYIELVLFIGWASYTAWQTYHVRWTDLKSANGTREPLLNSSSGFNATSQPEHLETRDMIMLLEGIQRLSKEDEPKKVESEENSDLKEEASNSMDVFQTTTQIPNVQMCNTESSWQLETGNDELASSEPSELPFTTENFEHVDTASDTVVVTIPSPSELSLSNEIHEQTVSNEEKQEEVNVSDTSIYGVEDEILLPPTSVEEKTEHLEIMTPFNFFWPSEESDSSSSWNEQEKISFTNEESEEVELLDKIPSSERPWKDENPVQSSSAPSNFIDGTLLRYRSGKLERCQFEQVVNLMYTLTCEPLKAPLSELAHILPRAHWTPYLDYFFVWNPDTEVVDICSLYIYTTGTNIVSCESNNLRTIDFLKAARRFSIVETDDETGFLMTYVFNMVGEDTEDTSFVSGEEVGYDPSTHPYLWKIYRINMVTKQKETCFVPSLISSYLEDSLYCLPNEYLRNSPFLSMPTIQTRFLIFNGIPKATMACPGDMKSLYWVVKGCRPVGDLIPLHYFMSDKAINDWSSTEEEPQELSNMWWDEMFEPTTASYTDGTRMETTNENDFKATEEPNVDEATPVATVSDYSTASDSHTNLDNLEVSSEISPTEDSDIYDYDGDYWSDEDYGLPSSLDYVISPQVEDEELTDTVGNPMVTNDEDPTVAKSNIASFWGDDSPIDESSYTEDDDNRLRSLDFEDQQLDTFRKRRSIGEEDLDTVETPKDPENEMKSTETKSGSEILTYFFGKMKKQDAADETENKTDTTKLKKINDRLFLLPYAHHRGFPRYPQWPHRWGCIFIGGQHSLFRRSTAAARKISNEIGDEKTSKEEFYERVRAKIASQASQKSESRQNLDMDKKFEKFDDKMVNLAAHIDRLHKRYLERMKLSDDYISKEFSAEENL